MGVGNAPSFGTWCNSWFNVMTINVIPCDRPEIVSGFPVISQCFYRLRPVRLSLKTVFVLFVSCKVVLNSDGSSENLIFSRQLSFSICDWEYELYTLFGVIISFAWSLRACISHASKFSSSSMSATKISPFQIPPAYNAHPKENSR